MNLLSMGTDTQDITFETHKSLITRVMVSQAGNFQFLHTIGNDVYVYVFGDRVGELVISGLSVPSRCLCPGNGGVDSDDHGFNKIMEWYNNNRVANRQTPITIVLGTGPTSPISGFVVGLEGDVVDPSMLLMQYNLHIATIPKKT